MCGIAGFVGNGNEKILARMQQAIAHRGPDDAGTYCELGVGLAHVRLAIIDLSPAGHQPMWDHEGRVAIVFNGEIYNYKILQAELRKLGHTFVSQSDTEVILEGYKEWGADVFKKIDGMFAIALWDVREKKLLLARDRMGKKPLYWGTSNNNSTLFFGSELKALVEHPDFKRDVDGFSLAYYLCFDSVPTPRSIWDGVQKLEPGSWLEWKDGKIKQEKFWELDFTTTDITPDEAVQKLDSLILEATKARLMSDVPLGVFLSGGIDSSTVAYYAQKTSSSKIKTFSLGFHEKSYDETSYAQAVAKHLGTEHQEQYVTAQDMLDVIPFVADIFDEPVADASVIPTYLLSKLTRQHVTVALGGDGGDELFDGYQTFVAEQFRSFFPLIRALGPLALAVLPSSDKYFSLDFKIKKFLDGAKFAGAESHARWLASFQPEELNKMVGGDPYPGLAHQSRFMPLAQKLGINEFYQRRYMMDQVLVKVDRASMRSALEVRAPLLDTKVVEFANSLPKNFKVHGITTKYILKKLMSDKLPREVVWRKKKGFAVPLAAWFRGPLVPLLDDLLSKKSIEQTGWLNYEYVAKLRSDHSEKKANNAKKLWNLVTLELWRRRWLPSI